MAPRTSGTSGVLAQCQKITKTTGTWQPSKARKNRNTLAYYVGIEKKNHLARYTISAPLLQALCAYHKHGNAPGVNKLRDVLNSAAEYGETVKNMPLASSLDTILDMEDVKMSSDGGDSDHKYQLYHGRILGWLVHHSNGWWTQLTKEEKTSSQVLAADEFRKVFPGRDLPVFDVTSTFSLPNWGPFPEFEEMEHESYNRAQQLIHFLYEKATSMNAPETIWGKDLGTLNDESHHDIAYKPTWMVGASTFNAAEYVEQEIQKPTLSTRTLELVWQEEGNYEDGKYGEAVKKKFEAMAQFKRHALLENLRKPQIVALDPRRFETPAPWRDSIRHQLNLGELGMGLQFLAFEAPKDDAVYGDLLNGVDWEGFKAAMEDHEVLQLDFLLRPLEKNEILEETDTPYGL